MFQLSCHQSAKENISHILLLSRCVSRRKWEALTAWASIPVPLIWLIFSLVYWALGGTNNDGDNFIYPVLKLVLVAMTVKNDISINCGIMVISKNGKLK